VVSPPSSPTNVSANTRPAGRAAPAAARWSRGGRTATRAQPTANRQRDAGPCTWASSAVLAAPQSRRSAGRAAAAAASSNTGPSSVDSLAPASRHQARHSSRAATIQGVPKTAIQIAMSRRARKDSGSSAPRIETTQR
jgi:hypothetical protein